MCVGLPCITTDVGDARLLLGQSGRVVPAGDVPALTQAMVHMADLDATQLQTMGSSARRRIAEHYKLNHAVHRYESLYQAALAPPYRSEERRVGDECVSTGRFRRGPDP